MCPYFLSLWPENERRKTENEKEIGMVSSQTQGDSLFFLSSPGQETQKKGGNKAINILPDRSLYFRPLLSLCVEMYQENGSVTLRVVPSGRQQRTNVV